MFFGRYLSIVIQLAIAGSLMRKQFVNDSIGTLRTDSATFTIGLVCVVYIFAALTFFPALALGLEREEPDVMERPPRPSDDGIFARPLSDIIERLRKSDTRRRRPYGSH